MSLRAVGVDSAPWGRVTIKPLSSGSSFQPTTQTTPFSAELPDGEYEFRLSADGLAAPYVRRVRITGTGPTLVRLTPDAFDPQKIVSTLLGPQPR
jgi:hypothetical protein